MLSMGVTGWCPRGDTNLFPTYHIGIYYYSTRIAHEEPVREEFTRTGSSFHVPARPEIANVVEILAVDGPSAVA
jgi:hypothetical protein